jgi:phage terminase large subunit
MTTVTPAVERVQLPHLFAPRSYQREVLDAYGRGMRRLYLLWHRRAGKDALLLNLAVLEMVRRIGTCFYLAPTFAQGKRIIWDGITAAGRPFRDHFPPPLVKGFNENELRVELTNGSAFQIIGTDDAHRVRGTNPIMCLFSEYALQSPVAWDYLSPILAENRGVAAFATTPQGRNHAYKLWEDATRDPEWFTSRRTVAETLRDAEGEDGQPVIGEKELEAERRRMPPELFAQEYECSFQAAMPGSYYARELLRSEAEGRISNDVAWYPGQPVHTCMDLGGSDATVLIFFQTPPQTGMVHVLDCYAARGEGTAHYVSVLQQYARERRWVYGTHWAPFDADTRHDVGQALVSRAEQWRNLGVRLDVLERQKSVQDGIQSTREIFPRVRFHKDRCRMLLDALAHYRSRWSEEKGVVALRPEHDWSSDYADAFRYLAQAVRGVERKEHSRSFKGQHPPNRIGSLSDHTKKFLGLR